MAHPSYEEFRAATVEAIERQREALTQLEAIANEAEDGTRGGINPLIFRAWMENAAAQLRTVDTLSEKVWPITGQSEYELGKEATWKSIELVETAKSIMLKLMARMEALGEEVEKYGGSLQ